MGDIKVALDVFVEGENEFSNEHMKKAAKLAVPSGMHGRSWGTYSFYREAG